LRLPPGQGKRILDVGCNWGRWCVAAAKIGYRPVGIDPSLGSVLGAQQVCRQLGVDAEFVVADARYMPFCERTFDTVFSYSVLQHFSKEDARVALNECRRVMNPPATCLIQMPNKWGIRCLWHQARRRFREPRDFEVRYWALPELQGCFAEILGGPIITVDGFFGLGIQPNDIDLLPLRFKMIVHASEMMRALSNRIPVFRYVADSLYVEVRL
jgi:SAM-dependent methyltransferase